ARRVKWVVAYPDFDEVLFHELPIPVNFGIVVLFVEIWSTVAGGATRSPGPAGRGSKEQLGAAQLCGRQRAIVAGQEPVEGCVPGYRRAQECRGCTQDSLIVDEKVDVVFCIGLSGLFGKCITEELDEGR